MVKKDNIICPYCGEDTGIPKILHMVIPDEGLKCPHCHQVVVRPSRATWANREDKVDGGWKWF